MEMKSIIVIAEENLTTFYANKGWLGNSFPFTSGFQTFKILYCDFYVLFELTSAQFLHSCL